MTPAELNVAVKGYEEQLKLRSEASNMNAWLIGVYVRIAVASALDSGVDYPEKPYGVETHAKEDSWQTSKLKMDGFAAKVEKTIKKKVNNHR